MRASDYIRLSEGIRSKELKLQNELSEIYSRIFSLQNSLDSLESELEILQMELEAAYSDTDEEGNVDYSRVGAIRDRMRSVHSRIPALQSEISEQESIKNRVEGELQLVENEKHTILIEIQSAANIKNQNISKLSGGLNGDYAMIGQDLQSAFLVSLGQLSQAASILGGSVSVASVGFSSGTISPSVAKISSNTAIVGGLGSRSTLSIRNDAIVSNLREPISADLSLIPFVSSKTISRKSRIEKSDNDSILSSLSLRSVTPHSIDKILTRHDEMFNNNNHFDIETGRFLTYYDEMDYDRTVAGRSNIRITEGMLSENASSAMNSLNSQIRYQIQIDAVEQQLKRDPHYFRKFGCFKETPSTIVKWFGKSRFTLHETKIGTVQIVDNALHKLPHSGGVAEAKWSLISGDGNNPYSSNQPLGPFSKAEESLIASMRVQKHASSSLISIQINTSPKSKRAYSTENLQKVIEHIEGRSSKDGVNRNSINGCHEKKSFLREMSNGGFEIIGNPEPVSGIYGVVIIKYRTTDGKVRTKTVYDSDIISTETYMRRSREAIEKIPFHLEQFSDGNLSSTDRYGTVWNHYIRDGQVITAYPVNEVRFKPRKEEKQ